MGKEINLLKKYPKAERNLDLRLEQKDENTRLIARKFGKDFFDGERKFGYGGFSYNPKYWHGVVDDMIKYWGLNKESSLLDVGCAKGFMLYDFQKKLPGISYQGIDLSKYAISNGLEEVRKNLRVADAKNIPFMDNSFDVVISINTIHNLDRENCKKALKEIQRVSKKNCFVTVDAFRNQEEEKRMQAWNLTAKTIMSVDEWKLFFKEAGYEGDYYWFIP
jgi:SAM-dependent methyltransferase